MDRLLQRLERRFAAHVILRDVCSIRFAETLERSRREMAQRTRGGRGGDKCRPSVDASIRHMWLSRTTSSQPPLQPLSSNKTLREAISHCDQQPLFSICLTVTRELISRLSVKLKAHSRRSTRKLDGIFPRERSLPWRFPAAGESRSKKLICTHKYKEANTVF